MKRMDLVVLLLALHLAVVAGCATLKDAAALAVVVQTDAAVALAWLALRDREGRR